MVEITDRLSDRTLIHMHFDAFCERCDAPMCANITVVEGKTAMIKPCDNCVGGV